jgi:hippurate hydrolase
VLDAAAREFDEVVALRRSIHREPELGTDNPVTQAKIVDALESIGLRPILGRGLSSVVADIEGDASGRTILLRADTDALPMTEHTGEAFASAVEGRAHMCGHDAHVAMLVGAARVLVARREQFAGRVRLAFQPGEEGFGGARTMIEEGVLEGVDAAFALHVTPNIPSGFAASRKGALMASTDDFEVTVRGRGGHASTPHFANDPLPVACEIVLALQTFVSRRINAFDPAVLTVGSIRGGTTTNVIAESTSFTGTIRTVSEDTRSTVREGFRRIVGSIAAAHECTAEVTLTMGYPVTVNDGAFVDFAAGAIESVLGPGTYFEMPSPVMGAEDFSYFLHHVPGSMAFLGVCPPDISNSLDAPGCHSDVMRLNEAAMSNGVAVHVGVAEAFLADS